MADKKGDYGSAYLYAEDLIHGGRFVTVSLEISEVIPENTIKAANGKLVDKPIIRFKGKNKQLPLCKTNVSVIKFVTGEQMGDGWIGKTIKLQVRVVESFGSKVLGLRVLPPVGAQLPKNVIERLGVEAVFHSSQSKEGN